MGEVEARQRSFTVLIGLGYRPFRLQRRLREHAHHQRHFDTNVVPESIVPALQAFVKSDPGGLVDARYGGDDPDAPSDTIVLRYKRSAFIPLSVTRTVYFPPFPKSGRFVSVSEPERLHAAIAEFMSKTEL